MVICGFCVVLFWRLLLCVVVGQGLGTFLTLLPLRCVPILRFFSRRGRAATFFDTKVSLLHVIPRCFSKNKSEFLEFFTSLFNKCVNTLFDGL